MRLLHVIRGMRPESGGPLEGLLRISEVLIRERHEIEILSLEREEEVTKRSFPIPVTAIGLGLGRYGFNPRLAPWLERNAGQFDAIILHGLWNYSSLGSWLALRKLSTPYYIFAHGMMSPWFRDRFPLKHLAKQAFWSLAEGRVLRDAKRVLFTCEQEKVDARNVFRGYRYRESVVRYGTGGTTGDLELQKDTFMRAFPSLRNRRYLLFMGRIHEIKGCDLLIRAFAELNSDLPSDIDVVMAGPDQVAWVPELRAQAVRLKVGDRVHWTGMLEGDLKWGAFRCADALVLPSHHENFGMVVAEAMACSTPVLISDKVNIWREVESAGAGLVEPDTLEGTRNLIRRFASLSAEERATMRDAAQQGFKQHFDVNITASDLIEMVASSRLHS